MAVIQHIVHVHVAMMHLHTGMVHPVVHMMQNMIAAGKCARRRQYGKRDCCRGDHSNFISESLSRCAGTIYPRLESA